MNTHQLQAQAANPIQIRQAVPEDTLALLQIYAPYVEKTAITFEYTIPTPFEFAERIRQVQTRYPWLVAERKKKPESSGEQPSSDGANSSKQDSSDDSEMELVGYAYTSPFHARAAYDWAVETSIYVQESEQHTGIGKQLYDALELISRQQGILNLNACIACPEVEDRYLTRNSIQFHEHLGYRMVGIFHHCGYKFETWYHMVWMEKLLGAHSASPRPVRGIQELDCRQILSLR